MSTTERTSPATGPTPQAGERSARPPGSGAGRLVDALYLSPHLDDVVLSCGGQIHRRVAAGEDVVVVTVFAGAPEGEPTPLAAELHALWGLPADPREALAARRDEDDAALAVLGAKNVRWDYVDAVYRGTPAGAGRTQPFYPTLRSLYAPATEHRRERALAEEIAARLFELPPAARLVVPLGVGRHVDHLLVRRVVQQALPGDQRVRYYEELPYARRFLAVRRARGPAAPGKRWQHETVRLTLADFDAKCRAIACYASQLRPVFDDEADLRQKVRRALHGGGERLWLERARR
jgi:LmbE family N-acetylglucosaminyl deacetylase